MFKFHTFVPASQIWPTAEDHVDHGVGDGASDMVRGYNVEVRKLSDGSLHWWSCEYTMAWTPEECFLDPFHKWMWENHGVELTGRICFRGYGFEEYDFEEHEHVVRPIEDAKALEIIQSVA